MTRDQALSTLGLQSSSNPSEVQIKKKYHALVRQFHPDRNYGNEEEAAEKFKLIENAYAYLNKKQVKQADLDKIKATITEFLLASMRSGLNETAFYTALKKALTPIDTVYRDIILLHQYYLFACVYKRYREQGISPYVRYSIRFFGEKVADFMDYIGLKIKEMRQGEHYVKREVAMKKSSEATIKEILENEKIEQDSSLYPDQIVDKLESTLTQFLLSSIKSGVNEVTFYKNLKTELLFAGYNEFDQDKIMGYKKPLFNIYKTCREQGISPYVRHGIFFVAEKVANFIDYLGRKIREAMQDSLKTRAHYIELGCNETENFVKEGIRYSI
jgi:curved DNA-binding protein CbpA